jgi:hypothetical protein
MEKFQALLGERCFLKQQNSSSYPLLCCISTQDLDWAAIAQIPEILSPEDFRSRISMLSWEYATLLFFPLSYSQVSEAIASVKRQYKVEAPPQGLVLNVLGGERNLSVTVTSNEEGLCNVVLVGATQNRLHSLRVSYNDFMQGFKDADNALNQTWSF